MFVVNSSEWRADLSQGQDRLLVELWLELASAYTTSLYCPPLCSTLQTLRNLLTTLQEVELQILREYHVRDSVEEILERLEECGWLLDRFPDDLTILREHLLRLRESHKEDKAGNEEDRGKKDEDRSKKEEERTRRSRQAEARRSVTSILRAFIAKVDQDSPIPQQVRYVRGLAATSATRFDVLSRAVAEVVNDLVHAGHSRDHLHGWVMGAVVKKSDSVPYLERFDGARHLGRPVSGGWEVLFTVAAPAEVQNSERLRFSDSLPPQFALPPTSSFKQSTKKRFVVVTVPSAPDRRAAVDQAHRFLLRYLHSTRLEHLDFERSISGNAAVRTVTTNQISEIQGSRRLLTGKLHNDEVFYKMPTAGRNEGTFAELDRVLYWIEQSRRWDEVGRLVALWTALEFLFSKTIRPAAESIQDLAPAYLLPNYPRELLIDFWAFIEESEVVSLPAPLEARLEVKVTGQGRRRVVNLLKFLELCLEDDATNPLFALIKDYPILHRKYWRVKRLDPKLKLDSSSDPEIWTDLDRFERRLEFDLRFAYRARNTIVHDAAIQIVQIDRLIQRLSWTLSTSLDTLLYQFVHNPTLSLTDLHELNQQNCAKWKGRLKDETKPVPLSEVVKPPQYCLVTG
jgi:hypothetical protein